MAGVFIVIEGADAVGKETQTRRLTERLRDRGLPAERFAFPRYATPLGAAIRAHLQRDLVFLDKDAPFQLSKATFSDGRPAGWVPTKVSSWSDLIFQCMASADKYEGAPAIMDLVARGGVAVCDRWWQSAYAYGVADGLPREWLLRLHQLLPKPDLNLLIRLPLEESRRRKPIPEDRYEEVHALQIAVRQHYDVLWADPPGGYTHSRARGPLRWAVIDGFGSEAVVCDRIMSEVARVC